MNVGGPAHHVSILSRGLDARGYETLLIAGRLGEGEASAEHLAHQRGVRLQLLPSLAPQIRPLDDLRALASLERVIRRFRPDIVHTHTAKAGFIGRLAGRIAIRPHPKIVHTYHGHVLEGYFNAPVTALYTVLERGCAKISDALIGVSESTVEDLVRLGVAPRDRFRVVPLGLELAPFLALGQRRAQAEAMRSAAGAGPDDVLVAFAGRLAPIKRVDVALEAIELAFRAGAPVRLLLAGDGELRRQLEQQARDLGIADKINFLGFTQDMPSVVEAADIALLTSDNEGTPVALIEAAAGGKPAVATDVGGVRSVVQPDTGRLCPAGDPVAIAAALTELAVAPELRQAMGGAARAYVRERFDAERLVDDIDRLYRSLLSSPGLTPPVAQEGVIGD